MYDDKDHICCQSCGTEIGKEFTKCPYCSTVVEIEKSQKETEQSPDTEWLKIHENIKQSEINHHEEKGLYTSLTPRTPEFMSESTNQYLDNYRPSGCSILFAWISFIFDLLFCGCGCLSFAVACLFSATIFILILK